MSRIKITQKEAEQKARFFLQGKSLDESQKLKVMVEFAVYMSAYEIDDTKDYDGKNLRDNPLDVLQ